MRPDPYVLARFLDALHHEPGTAPVPRSKSSLQRACRVNYDLFRRYLDFCEDKGFVHIEKGDTADAITLTDAGREMHTKLLGWIRDLLGSVRL